MRNTWRETTMTREKRYKKTTEVMHDASVKQGDAVTRRKNMMHAHCPALLT